MTNMNNISRLTRGKGRVALGALSLALIAALTLGASAARSVGYHEPISVESSYVGVGPVDAPGNGDPTVGDPNALKVRASEAAYSAMLGETTIPVHVVLDGGPEQVTIYSSPAGAVSFQGVIDADATVDANVDPNASGDVTIYAITDGAVVQQTVVHL